MTVFVTGGSGFVGRHLIKHLIARGHSVRALARSEAAARAVSQIGAEPARGNLTDRESVNHAVAGCDDVIHAAAYLELWGSYEVFHRVNVEGTDNLLNAAIRAGVGRFVQIGAAGVVKNKGPVVMADESAPLQTPPFAPYIATKAISEERVRAANRDGFRTVVVRPPAI